MEDSGWVKACRKINFGGKWCEMCKEWIMRGLKTAWIVGGGHAGKGIPG